MSELTGKVLSDEITYGFPRGQDKELMATEADKRAHNQESDPCKSFSNNTLSQKVK